MAKKSKANIKYKNSVFTMLFGEIERLRELLGALYDTVFGDDVEIRIATLDNALYMTLLNDIACVVDNKLVVLIEHQSTINENMPLRMLIYVASVYELIFDKDDLYKKNMIPIPRPEFIVLYNGKDDMPEEQTLRLSDMFMKCSEEDRKRLGDAVDRIDLELTVKVYNINKGYNQRFAQKSPTLDGYETFVAKVREFEKVSQNLDEAVGKAIDYCIENNILKQFLESNSKEVRNMLTTEWDMETALKVSKQEGIEEGIEEGIAQANRDNARAMKVNGIDINLISTITGLDVSEIRRL